MKSRTRENLPGGAGLFLAGTALRTTARWSPDLAARAAGALFRFPPRHKTTEAERLLLAAGRRRLLATPAGRVAVWSWGQGPPVLLLHGWGSRGVRLHSFVEPIVAAGHCAVTFDAPGHGESAGHLSSLPQFVDALFAVAAATGAPRVVVAHSMGGATAAVAMGRGLDVERAVFLAPPANPATYWRRFLQALGLSEDVRRRMERQFEERFGFQWEELDVPSRAAAMTARLLVFHDEDDREVPWSDGAAIARAWPGARLVTMRGLGHKRIVHDPDVVSEAVAFATSSPAAAAALTI